MTPDGLSIKKGGRTVISEKHLIIFTIVQVCALIVFNVIFTTYLLSREMRAHELRDTLQDMRMNRISAVMAERLHVTIDECGNCHTATRNKFLIERD